MVSGREWPPRGDGGFSARGAQKAENGSQPDLDRTDRRFGRERRLRQRKEFIQVLSRGFRLNTAVVAIAVRPNGINQPRLGLAISRRVVRRAVGRHRLKRRIRESFRHNIARLRGLDVVVLARPGVANMSSNDLSQALERLWQRASRQARRSPTAP